MGPEPVEIVHERDHQFVKRAGRGCAVCAAAKTALAHWGAPPSLNAAGSGGNRHAYQATKKLWQAKLAELLTQTGLPTGLDSVLVEGEMTFPDRQRRDQGNFRYFIEKALGDALATGGWLEDDDWTRYEFGGLAYRYEKGVSRTRLMIFPAAHVPPRHTQPDQQLIAA